MQAAVVQVIGNGQVEVSNFIRMEYLRGVVLNLIELYFLCKESDSVSDAPIDWTQKVNQERKLKVLLLTMRGWLLGHEDWEDKDKSLWRLGHQIVRLVYEFDDLLPGRAKDQLVCRLGRIRFPRRAFREDMLLRFYEQFRAIQTGVPACHLCLFKTRKYRTLIRRGIDLRSPAHRQTFAKNKGYLTQVDRLEEAMATKDTFPRCRWCERLGDTIIILQAPAKAVLITADRTFEALGQILNREIRRLPSMAELKHQLDPPNQPDVDG